MSVSDDFADLSPSHLRVADIAFQTLVSAPRLLTLDCTVVGGVRGAELGLPQGPVELLWLRTWMLDHRDNYPARDAVWRELIDRARTLGGDWRIVAVAMAMPALIRFAGSLARDYRGDPADLDNEILTGFLDALQRRVDLGESRLYTKLCWAGFRAGYAARYAHIPEVHVEDLDGDTSVVPHLPYGHPDLLLARAVAIKLIDQDDADLITATWLERKTIEQVARATGIDPAVLRMRRLRAGRRVGDAIVDGLLSGTVSTAVLKTLAARAAARADARIEARTHQPQPAAALAMAA